MREAFTRELGTKQGAIAPARIPALSGTSVLCLGYDGAGRFEELSPGDFAQVEQQATFTTGTKLFRIPVIIIPPKAIPNGYRWVVRVLLDDALVVEKQLVAGDVQRRHDFAINVSKVAAGNHIVTIRLQFLTDDTKQYIVMTDFECGP